MAVAAAPAAADPDRYPDAGPAHRIRKIYQTAFSRERWLGLMATMNARGLHLPWNFEDEIVQLAAGRLDLTAAGVAHGQTLASGADVGEGFGTSESELTTRVDVAHWLDAKRAAMACHRTQRQDMGWALELPPDLRSAALGVVRVRWLTESLVVEAQAAAVVPFQRYRLSFDGLPDDEPATVPSSIYRSCCVPVLYR